MMNESTAPASSSSFQDCVLRANCALCIVLCYLLAYGIAKHARRLQEAHGMSSWLRAASVGRADKFTYW